MSILLACFTTDWWTLHVHAATITVDVACTLIDAITAANTDTAIGACPAGNGADVIVLTSDIIFSAINNTDLDGSANALPVISSVITIEGAGHTISRTGALEFRFIRVAPVTGDLSIRNLTLQGGVGSPSVGPLGSCAIDECGGAIYNESNLTLDNVTLANNWGGTSSGQFDGLGGGIYSSYGTLRIYNSTFSANSARLGGGIYLFSGTLEILANSRFVSNQARGEGAGLAVRSAAVTRIDLTTFSQGNGDGGVSIYNLGQIGTISNSTFADNFSLVSGGGGIQNDNSIQRIEGSTFVGNSVNSSGGGIFNRGFIGTFVNNTLSANAARSSGGGGAAIYNQGTITTLANVTMYGNSLNGVVGGAGIFNQAAGVIGTMSNVLIDNSLSGGNCFGTVPSGVNNRSSDATCNFAAGGGADNDNGLALLPLADNGGATQTHALNTGSTAINSGDNCGLIVDQRWAARDSNCDVGAFESGATVGLLSFSLAPVVIYENPPSNATVTITVTNPGSSNFDGDVTAYFTLTGSAIGSGIDYNTTLNLPITISAAPPGTSTQTFAVSALNDGIFDPAETVVITLSGFSGPVTLVGSNPQTLTIEEVAPTATPTANGTFVALIATPTSSAFPGILPATGIRFSGAMDNTAVPMPIFGLLAVGLIAFYYIIRRHK